jgi:hypothetical protein
MSALADLIQSAGVPVSRTPQRLRDLPVTLDKERRIELETVLHLRDGFLALDGALLIRPSVTVGTLMGISDWNRLSGWRQPYAKSSELLFFADDIFGHCFALYRDGIVRFNPERGTYEHYAFKLEAWAARVLEEKNSFGIPQIEAWRAAGKPELATYDKLQPSTPRLAAVGGPVEYTKRTDRDLMRRYAKLYRELSAADGIASGLNLYWWTADDPEAPEPEPTPEPEPEPTPEPEPALEPEPSPEPASNDAPAVHAPDDAASPEASAPKLEAVPDIKEEPIPEELLASAEAEVEALLRENAEAREDEDETP